MTFLDFCELHMLFIVHAHVTVVGVKFKLCTLSIIVHLYSFNMTFVCLCILQHVFCQEYL